MFSQPDDETKRGVITGEHELRGIRTLKGHARQAGCQRGCRSKEYVRALTKLCSMSIQNILAWSNIIELFFGLLRVVSRLVVRLFSTREP